MSAPSNETAICNLALDHLNQESIESLDDPQNKSDKLCARWYDQVRRSTLRMHTWNFAMKRTTLAVLSDSPAFEYDNQYQLPSDYIRVVAIGADNQYKNYGLEDGKLLCNANGAALAFRYVYDATAVEKFDPLFVEVFALQLAMRLAYPITGSNTAAKRVQEMLTSMIPIAMGVDGQERPPRRYERSRFKEARRKNGTYGSPYLED